MEAASAIISETDLVQTALALRFCTTLLRQQRTLGPQVTQRVLPQALTLIKSPMLQVFPLSAPSWPVMPAPCRCPSTPRYLSLLELA